MSTETSSSKRWLRTLKILAAYLVAAWTFLQFVDWALNRYNISPYWVDVLLWVFVGIIPSLVIYLYNQERINMRILKLREKIIFPLNLIILFIVLYVGFGNSDLGATTKEITYTNEEGELESKTITKEEFRIGFAIFSFENQTGDESLEWLRYGIGRLIEEDLFQNKNLSPDFTDMTGTSAKIKEASLFYDFYVDGHFKKNGDNFEVTTYIRKANNSKVLAEQTFTGPELLPLLDEISVFITNESGFVESNKVQYLDFPINEFMSKSLDAVKHYIHGDYTKAVAEDQTFAMAYLQDAKRALRFNRGKLEAQDIVDKAFRYRNKLPLQKQLEVNIQRNLAYENFEDAERQVKLQLEVDPHNDFYNQVLTALYGETRQIEKNFTTSEALFVEEPNPDNGVNLAVAALVSGDDQGLIDAIEQYEIINPSISLFKLQPLLFQGRIDEAKSLLDDVKTLHPSYSNRWKVYDSAIAYLSNHKIDISDYEKFVGSYRSDYNEQTCDLWIDNDRIIQYVKNQNMSAYLLGGPNSIVSGIINDRTWELELKYAEASDKPIGFVLHQNDFRNSVTLWYWKEDASIKKAHEAYDSGDMTAALRLYEAAYEQHPTHGYLKNTIDHLNYQNATSKDSIQLQFAKHAGSYGPREFWVEDGKLYYKRKEETVNLARVELLPLDANTYMNLTKLGTKMAFETTEDGKLASYAYSFNSETMTWERLDNETNYYLKDE